MIRKSAGAAPAQIAIDAVDISDNGLREVRGVLIALRPEKKKACVFSVLLKCRSIPRSLEAHQAHQAYQAHHTRDTINAMHTMHTRISRISRMSSLQRLPRLPTYQDDIR